MRRGEFEPRSMPDWHGGVARKPDAARAKGEKGPARDLTQPGVMVYLEALVDAKRRQEALQEELRVLDTQGGKLAGQEVKRQVLAAQWKTAEESLHAAAMRASQALGLGDTLGRSVEPAEIPAPGIPKREVPAPLPHMRRAVRKPASEERAAA